MKASIVAASAAFIGSVAAAHKAHAGFHLRRAYADSEICTVYTTVYVTAGEYPTLAPNTTVVVEPTPYPVVSTTCTEEKEKATSTPVYVPVPEPKPSKEAYVPVAPPAPSKEAPKPKPKPSKPANTDYSHNGRIVTKGDRFGITYTPYASGGDCKSEGEIKEDIKKIAELGFTTIRSYSTDCGVFEYVVPACQKHGLKVIYGIFLEGEGKGVFSEYANSQLDDIVKLAPKDTVAMVIVGNECIFNNNCEASELGKYIDHVRQTLRSAGFPEDIAVTTTEPVGTWEEKGKALCSHIDLFTVQVHPYFTEFVSADKAGEFAAQQLEQAAKVCPEVAAKGKYISEIGWPKGGNDHGNAKANPDAQKIAMKKIVEKIGKEAVLFSFQDDGWKHPGEFNVEQHFGCADVL